MSEWCVQDHNAPYNAILDYVILANGKIHIWTTNQKSDLQIYVKIKTNLKVSLN